MGSSNSEECDTVFRTATRSRSNRTRLLLLGFLTTFIVLAAILLRPGVKVAMPKIDKPEVIVAPISPTPPQAKTAPAISSVADQVYEHTEVQRNQRLEEFFGAPVNFFGKVVDQNGNPVSGAKTFYNVSTASLSGSPTLKGPDTNEYGAFEITGERGPSLSVSVDHPDFYKTGTSSPAICLRSCRANKRTAFNFTLQE